MIIAIPSRGRAGKVRTLDFLPHDARPHLVVPASEMDDYHRAYPDLPIIGGKWERIGEKRQYMIELWSRNGGQKLVMMDDDLRFRERYATDDNFAQATPEDIGHMLRMLDITLDQTPHAGIADEFMCQHQPRGHRVGGRYNQVLAYDLRHDLFQQANYPPAFRLSINEEHDFHLQLARLGHPPIVLTDWTKGSKYQASGGCSTWRTPEVEASEFRKFAELWPDYVKIVPNVNSISGLATRVNWRKAYA